MKGVDVDMTRTSSLEIETWLRTTPPHDHLEAGACSQGLVAAQLNSDGDLADGPGSHRSVTDIMFLFCHGTSTVGNHLPLPASVVLWVPHPYQTPQQNQHLHRDNPLVL